MMRCCCAAADYRFPARGIKQRASFSGLDRDVERNMHGSVQWKTRRTRCERYETYERNSGPRRCGCSNIRQMLHMKSRKVFYFHFNFSMTQAKDIILYLVCLNLWKIHSPINCVSYTRHVYSETNIDREIYSCLLF